MKMITIFFSALIVFLSQSLMAKTSLNIEAGQAKSSYNKVKIEGDEGTRFNLAPGLDSTSYYRLSLINKFDSPHGLRFLYAPLKFSGKKRFSKTIDFGGVNFTSNDETKTEYQFNSYRGTYFYQVISDKNFMFRMGGTLKIRDAKIELNQHGRKKFKKNTGIVPLLYIYSEYKWNKGIRMALDFDGLAAPQGRAFDMALMGGYYFSPSYHLNLGYRVLEGGVDNDNVYNFSWISYYFTSLQINF